MEAEKSQKPACDKGTRYVAGFDRGSTTGKGVLLREDGAGRLEIAATAVRPTGFVPEELARSLADEVLRAAGLPEGEQAATVCATGYGRESVPGVGHSVSEITCHARGAHWVCPDVRTVVDVGGQDVKIIALDDDGSLHDFTMNDRCAAGTGRFFESMARILQVSVGDLGLMATRSDHAVPITSQCSVFAESEVVSYVNQAIPREDIAAGIHLAIAQRIFAMAQRVGVREKVLLTGGCAKNEGLRRALQEVFGLTLAPCPVDPQVIGALGAALCAHERLVRAERRAAAGGPGNAAAGGTQAGAGAAVGAARGEAVAHAVG